MPQHKLCAVALLLGVSLMAGPGQAQMQPPPPQGPITEPVEPGPILPAVFTQESWVVPGPELQLVGAPLPAGGAIPAENRNNWSPAALVLGVTGPETVAPGQAAVYQIVVRNLGKTSLASVRIEQLVPEGLASVATQPRAGRVQERLVWLPGDLEPRGERRLGLELVPSTSRELKIEPTATFTSAAARTRILQQPLAVTQTGPMTADRGSKATIQVRITNNTATALHNITLLDELPQGLVHPQGKRIETELGTLGPGESRDLPLEVEVAQAGPLVNEVSARAQEGHLVRSRWTIQGNEPALQHQVIAPRQAGPGESVDVRLDIHNPTAAPVHKVRLACTPGEGLELVAFSRGGSHDQASHAACWEVESLPAGQTLTVIARLRGLKPGEWSYQTQVLAEGVAPVQSVKPLTIGPAAPK